MVEVVEEVEVVASCGGGGSLWKKSDVVQFNRSFGSIGSVGCR